ncbi:hypothetical protein RP20_CCG018382 [Aedes albopictus]|nr:hypothetical protein RP20_CCG018382 [Aedes albopictus]
MSAGFRSPGELLMFGERSGSPVEGEETSKYFKRSASEKHFSVRKLVQQFESRASNRFERISDRFSSKRKKVKHTKKDADSDGSFSADVAATAKAEKPLSTALWYLPRDKITEDSDECEHIDDKENIDVDFEEEVLPDVGEICDCWNEFIYLQLSKEKAEYLNSYNSDYEEDWNETSAEASNTIISLNWPGDAIHYIVHGYYQPTDKKDQQLEQDVESDDGFSESEASGFYDAEISLEPVQVEGNVTKLSYLIEELIETERNYINTLERGITTYIRNVFDTFPIPVQLVNMKYHLFGNIEYIHQFHQTVFLPKLIDCGKAVQKLAEVFCKYIENDSFYGYVLYSLYNAKSQRLCEQFAQYFEGRQNCSGDKLGVKSFILQPIQRLPRYKILLDSIAKALRSSESVSGDEFSAQLNSVLQARQMMESFITTMNESMEIVEIVECKEADDNEVELGFGVPKPATVLREQNSENQFIFLFPRESENMERIKPINLLHQGKFKKAFPVFFNDLRLGRQYKGKLFIFERCIFYTEELKTKQLSYRGHFSHLEVSYDFSNLQILRIVSEKDERHCIEVKINIQNPEANLVLIVELLRSIIARRKKKDSFIMESKELTIIRNLVKNRFNSYRSSLSSTSSSFSYLSSVGQNQTDDVTSMDCITQHNNESSFDQLVNYNQYYEKSLKDNTQFYIYSLPNDVRQRLLDLSDVLEEMLKIQQGINFRLFEDNLEQTSELSFTHLCDTFHDSLKQSEFEVFLRYVQHMKPAEAVLMSFEHFFAGLPKSENVICLSIDAFLHLPVEFVNRCCAFFEAIYSDIHSDTEEITLRNPLLDYKITYVRSQLSLLRQRVNENYYIRQLIMDVDFLQEIELVQYSEIIKLEGSYANYRLFLMKTGLLCMKINQDKHDQPETYSSVTLYYPYTKTTARNSHRSGKRWSAYLDGRKTTLIFQDKQKRYVFNERYSTLAEQMRQREGVRKKSFFSAFENK